MTWSQRKLIYICPEYPGVVSEYGGIGVSMRQESQWFASRGYDVTVVCQTDTAAPGLREDSKVKITVIGDGRVPKLRALTNRWRVADECRRLLSRGPGIVICPDYCGPLWVKLFRQPLLVQLHGCATLNAVHQGKRGDRLVSWFERRTIKLADAIQSCSNFTAERTKALMGLDGVLFSTIHHPVDHRQFSPNAGAVKPNEILFVGKFNALKGVFTLASAAVEVFREVPQARLAMVGSDTVEDGESVQKQFLERIPLEFRDRVEVLGRRSRLEVARLMQRAGIVVFPSRIEALPLVLLEAMSSGRPVVASARGGIPEIVFDGVTGLLANPDDPSTFARSLITLLKNPGIANSMGEAARRRIVGRSTLDIVYERTEKYHSELLQPNRELTGSYRFGRDSRENDECRNPS